MNANLSLPKNSFNLYPKDIKKQRNIKRTIYYILALLLLLNMGFGAYTFTQKNMIATSNAQRVANTNRLKEAEPLLQLDKNIKAIKADVDKITAYQKSITSVEVPSFDILEDLELKVPTNITLNSVTIADDGKINLVGLSKDEFVVSDLVTALKQIEKFSQVYLKSVVKKEDEANKTGEYVNIFTIDCQVKGIEKNVKK